MILFNTAFFNAHYGILFNKVLGHTTVQLDVLYH